jgi:hypothetical protein
VRRRRDVGVEHDRVSDVAQRQTGRFEEQRGEPAAVLNLLHRHDLTRLHARQVSAFTREGEKLAGPQVEHRTIESQLQLFGRSLADRRFDRQLRKRETLALNEAGGLA